MNRESLNDISCHQAIVQAAADLKGNHLTRTWNIFEHIIVLARFNLTLSMGRRRKTNYWDSNFHLKYSVYRNLILYIEIFSVFLHLSLVVSTRLTNHLHNKKIQNIFPGVLIVIKPALLKNASKLSEYAELHIPFLLSKVTFQINKHGS